MTFSDTKTWLITGAGRGTGVDFARAALVDAYRELSTDLAHDDARVAA